MPRPKHTIRPAELKVSIPSDVFTQVGIELYSPLKERIPYGAWSELVTTLLNRWLRDRGLTVPESSDA